MDATRPPSLDGVRRVVGTGESAGGTKGESMPPAGVGGGLRSPSPSCSWSCAKRASVRFVFQWIRPKTPRSDLRGNQFAGLNG